VLFSGPLSQIKSLTLLAIFVCWDSLFLLLTERLELSFRIKMRLCFTVGWRSGFVKVISFSMLQKVRHWDKLMFLLHVWITRLFFGAILRFLVHLAHTLLRCW